MDCIRYVMLLLFVTRWGSHRRQPKVNHRRSLELIYGKLG